ncbi:hypothetical protein GDO86_017439 [Hymenochirus boettgeri]|uniref:Uncharacterized protein n=1 Tax=Hymenochirus boettgeri TaxID=247094 RepID=A0A8T2IK23_9PIPI|nr:hypothetical protein GDO86_017439 [Hymenochirus boettgeri]
MSTVRPRGLLTYIGCDSQLPSKGAIVLCNHTLHKYYMSITPVVLPHNMPYSGPFSLLLQNGCQKVEGRSGGKIPTVWTTLLRLFFKKSRGLRHVQVAYHYMYSILSRNKHVLVHLH